MKNLILIFALALAATVNAQQVEFVALNELCSTDTEVVGIEVTYQTAGDLFLSVDRVQSVLPNQSFLINNSREFDYILATVVDTQGNVVATKMIFPCHLEANKNNVISVY